MAFLSNEIKFYSKNMSATQLIGPGFYELNKNSRPKQNLIPFCSSEKRKNIINKINDFPGPGSYNLTLNSIKNKQCFNEKNEQNKKKLNIEFFDALSNNLFFNNKNLFKKFLIKENLNSQTKRFSNNNNSQENFNNEKNNLIITNNNNNKNKNDNNHKTINFYHNYNYQQFKANLTNKNNLKKNSIPEKNFIGYYLDENENLITIENSDLNNIYTGLEGNQIGPGNYNLNLKWENKSCLWSLSKNKRGLLNNKEKNLQETLKENFKNKENQILNKNKNNKNIFLEFLKNKIKNVKYNIKTKRNVIKKREIIFNKCLNNNPGPGYYYNNEKDNNKNNNNKNYNFGSEKPRFDYEIEKNIKKNIRIPSPTKYFTVDSEKLKKLHNLIKLPYSYREIKYHNKKNIPFLTTSQRFTNKISNKTNFLDLNPPLKKISFNYKLSNFNSTPRFTQNKNESNNNPGPGSYINPYTGEGYNNTVYFNGILTSIENARKNNHSNSSVNIIKNNIKLSPDVGEYFPETFKSIEFDNLKKTKPVHPAFDVSSPKKLDLKVNSSVDCNLGPGSYFNVKEIVPIQKYPPFNISETKTFKLKKNLSENHFYNNNNNFEEYQFKKKEFNVLYI